MSRAARALVRDGFAVAPPGLTVEQLLMEAACPSEKVFDQKITRFVRDLQDAGRQILTYHTYRSQRSEPGFPDRVILTAGWCWLLELKVGNNRPTTAQVAWLGLFATVPGVTARVLYPRDWPAVADDILARLGVSPTTHTLTRSDSVNGRGR